jgi:hypothetical protein
MRIRIDDNGCPTLGPNQNISLSAHYATTLSVQISCANLNILAESNLRTQINCRPSSGRVGTMRFRSKRHTSVYRGAMAWLRLDGKLAAHQL